MSIIYLVLFLGNNCGQFAQNMLKKHLLISLSGVTMYKYNVQVTLYVIPKICQTKSPAEPWGFISGSSEIGKDDKETNFIKEKK